MAASGLGPHARRGMLGWRARLLAGVLVAAAGLGCRTRGGFVLALAPVAGAAGADAGAPDVTPPDVAGVGGAAGGGAGGGAGAVLPETTFYISPDGSDGNPGTTEAAPWRTFGHALPVLQPGSTLVLLDGTYTSGTSGLLQVFCGMNAVNGTPRQPITVRALNE